MRKYKSIGILGGMGPEATAELYKRIISKFQRRYGAIDDADFPSILINSIPIADMLSDLPSQTNQVRQDLQRGVKVLEQAGADFIAIPCNTAHVFLSDMQAEVSIPVLNLLELTSSAVEKSDIQTVGLLATNSTVSSGAYSAVLDRFGVNTLVPPMTQQRQVDEVIMRILSGNKNAKDRKALRGIAQEMVSNGAQAIILGCTELPLLLTSISNILVIDTIDVLAEAVVTTSRFTRSD